MSVIKGVGEVVGVQVSVGILKKFLKKQGYSYRRIRKWLKGTPDAALYKKKVKELELLIALEKHEFLTLYYADESGFSETPCVPYGWQPKSESLRIPCGHGRRCNVFGLMARDQELHTYLSEKSINSKFVIDSIDDFVYKRSQKGRSIIIIDNAKIHHSREFKAKIQEWAEQNVGIFYLPPYSPHLNIIEILWRKIKYEWFVPDDFVSYQTMKQQLEYILKHFGIEFTINFDGA